MKNIRRVIILGPLIILALLGFAWQRLARLESRNVRANIPAPKWFRLATNVTNSTALASSRYDQTLAAFWENLSSALHDTAPKCILPTGPIEAPINKFASVGKNFNYRPDLLALAPQDVEDLKDAHTRYVARIEKLAPQLPFSKGTKGIVTTAAGEFMPPLIVSLRMLRRTGSKLPVEVFMENSTVYEPDICEAILPKLNATCKVMSEIFDTAPTKTNISKYQLKAFAMLFSSFDNMLLIDADNIALATAENLLADEPFVSRADIKQWANTASPKYYEISSQPAPAPSALYYNFYGPSHYYKLLSQGAVGEGDKETYLAAAMALKSNFYTVQENIGTLGYQFGDAKNFKGCGAIQHDPSDDYQKNELRNTKVSKIRPAFIHAQTYKMNADTVVATFQAEINQRMWENKKSMVERFGRDVEKQMWADTLYTGCQLEHSFKDWQGKNGICKRIGRVYKFLFD
ncbi:alpha 1,2-mannosyltransferase, partial [Lecanoromycetidae sp. Uapishka_2]